MTLTIRDAYLALLSRSREPYLVVVGGLEQKSALVAVIPPRLIWSRESLATKLRALGRLRWHPSSEATSLATAVFLQDEVFGGLDDFGPQLIRLWEMHGALKWEFGALLPPDLSRAEALEAHTCVVRGQLNRFDSDPPLNLKLARRQIELCHLAYPMVCKVPIVSFRNFLEVHSRFAFARIREARHPQSDGVIAIVYELLFLQQKTALALNHLVERAATSHTTKGDSLIHLEELESLLGVDLLVSYLKATVEKTLNLVALTHGIVNLDTKKTHKAKLATLVERIPKVARETAYFDFVLEMVSSGRLSELNDYRTGLLHKRGIGELQPHSFFRADPASTALRTVVVFLVEQHASNTAALVAALALLTDELVRLHPPVLPDIA